MLPASPGASRHFVNSYLTRPCTSSASMTQTSTSQPDKRHVRQNTRVVVPVIPRHFGRKSTDKGVKKEPNGTDDSATGKGNGQPSPAPASTKTTSESRVNGDSAIVISDDTSSDAQTAGKSMHTAPESVANNLPEVVEASQSVTGAELAAEALTAPEPVKVGNEADAGSLEGTNNGTHHHEPLEKRSMGRTARVELPPPFYPNSHAAIHGDRENRKSFVFGGAVDSSAPSPIPPPSAGSWNSSSGPAFTDGMTSPNPHQTNGFTPSGQYINGDRSAATSMASYQSPYPPSQYQPWVNGVQFQHQRPFHILQTTQSPRSPSVGSNPSDVPFAPQHHAFPSITQSHFYNAGYPTDFVMSSGPTAQRHVPQFSSHSLHPSRGSGHFDLRGQTYTDPSLHTSQALRDHVEAMFDNSEFSDCKLRVSHGKDGQDVSKDILGHSVILSRSPALRRMLLTSGGPREDGLSILEIPSDAVYCHNASFILAIRYLYGGSLLRREHLQQKLGSPQKTMAFILSYVAAGWYLEVPEIATAGLALVEEHLIPDNLDIAAEFALEQTSVSTVANGSAGVNGHASPVPQTPKYRPYASELLQAIQQFLAFALTSNFELDISAPELGTIRRIPPMLQPRPTSFAHPSRHSISNPKLQGMTLGSFQTHSSANRILSSALLSFPTFVLQLLFASRIFRERMPPEALLGLVGAVVAERENRRRAALDLLPGLSEVQRGKIDASQLIGQEEMETLPPEQGLLRIVVRQVEGQNGSS